MRRQLLLVPIALAVAGCSLTLDTKELDPLQQPQGFCETVESEAMQTIARCFSVMSGFDVTLYGLGRTYCGAIVSDVASGTVGYDQGAATACVDAIRSARCSDIFGSFFSGGCPASERFGVPVPGICSGACRAALAGAVSAGGACTTDLQCTSGHCSVPSATCGGTCVAGTAGDPCDFSHGCASGHYCGGGTCVAYLNVVSAPCTMVKCNPATLYCDQVTFRCAQLAGASASCGGSSGVNCATGLYCSTTLFCATKAAVGESCALNRPCGDGLSCDAATTLCVATPTRAEPIDGDCHFPRFCDSDVAYCDDGSGAPTYTCIAKRTSGFCASFDECALGYYCSSGSQCEPLKDAGQSCTIGVGECRLGGACVPSLGGGASCVREPTTVGAECGSFGGGEYVSCVGDLSCDESLIPGHCVPARTEGETCTGSYDSCAGNDRGAYCDLGSGTCTAPCW
ncbi:MAG TPA: hypothetical protein VF912_01885 [Anaeromyxobacter sp.]